MIQLEVKNMKDSLVFG